VKNRVAVKNHWTIRPGRKQTDGAMRILKNISCCLFLAALPCSLHAQAKSAQKVSTSLPDFVRSFYDWYVPKALAENAVPASERAIKYRSSSFSPELIRALREDSEAQAKAQGTIVGLDFDPFLNSQDPAERYRIGPITKRGSHYWVDVYGVWPGKKREKPDVVPELMHKNGHWIFVNFHYEMKEYPDDGDLLTILKILWEDRQKPF
jgi:hypothetical protein